MITIEKAHTGVAAWVLRKYQSHPKPASFDMRKHFFRVGSVRGDGRLSNPNIIRQMAQVLKGSDDENKVRYDDDKMINMSRQHFASFRSILHLIVRVLLLLGVQAIDGLEISKVAMCSVPTPIQAL